MYTIDEKFIYGAATRRVPKSINSLEESLFFQDFILPVLKIQRAIGFAPFHIDNEGKLSTGFNVKVACYSVFAYSIVLAATLITQFKLTQQIKKNDSSFNMILFRYLNVLALTQQLLGPFPFILQRRKFQGFFQKWSFLQEEYTTLTGNNLRLDKVRKLRKIVFSLSLVSVTLCNIHAFTDKLIENPFMASNVAFTVYLLHQLSLICYWLFTSKAIQLAASQYEYHFSKEVRGNIGYTRKIEAYRLLWMRLSKITKNFASSIGITITACLIFHVLYMILAAYRVVVAVPEHLRESNFRAIVILIADLIFHLGIILFYCNVGHNVTKYCTNNMLSMVLEIRECSLRGAADNAKVNIFLHTISDYSPIVGVSGFYEINRALFGGIVSALLTYIIVIIQLKDSM